MPTKTYLLAEREYIAILGLVYPLVELKRGQSLTPADFDATACALEIIEAFAIQRLDSPPVTPVEPTE
ncbi:hypothetical protein D9M71_322560 [compost metagenome]